MSEPTLPSCQLRPPGAATATHGGHRDRDGGAPARRGAGPASAQITRELLGWEPTRPGLIANLKEGHYFA